MGGEGAIAGLVVIATLGQASRAALTLATVRRPANDPRYLDLLSCWVQDPGLVDTSFRGSQDQSNLTERQQ
jgi:hypothetical protein